MSQTTDVAQGHETRRVEHGDSKKAIAHVPPGEGARSLWVLDVLVTYKIPSHRTGGAYALFEVATRSGTGPPPHIHHREDEAFYVLEGEYEFLIERRTLRVEAGSLLYVPKGTLHAHRNVGENAGRMLVTQTPGGLYERFFKDVGKALGGEMSPQVFRDSPDMGKIVKVAAEHGIEIPPMT